MWLVYYYYVFVVWLVSFCYAIIMIWLCDDYVSIALVVWEYDDHVIIVLVLC